MLELAFAFYLVVVMPARALWRSRAAAAAAAADRPAASLLRGYGRQARHVGLLLAVLAGVERHAGRSLAGLGLEVPLSLAGRWGLVATLGVFAAMLVGDMLWRRRLTPQALAEQQRKLVDGDIRWPHTGIETAAFVASMTLMCVAWEVLYRGFLLLVLTPPLGLAPAIAVAAFAYGAAHGYKSRGQFIGAIVSACLFTLGYALTHSLWWLIVLHVAAPVGMLWAVRRIRREQALVAASPSASTSTSAPS